MVDTPQVLVANAGTLRVFQVAAQLHRHGMLKKCATTLHFASRHFRWFPSPLRERLLRQTANRRCASIDGLVDTFVWPELVYLAARQFGAGRASSWIQWRNRIFCRRAGRRLLEGINMVWAFDTSSYELFLAAKRRGIRCVLDLSIAHPALGNRILREYAKRRPEIAPDMELQVPDDQVEHRREEIQLADQLVVGSSFVRDSLLAEGVPAAKIRVNPYGVDLDQFYPEMTPQARAGTRFLFVGWFSPRKGIYDLLEAWKKSGLVKNHCELYLAGGTRNDLRYWKETLPEGVSVMGQVPHPELPGIYRRMDVFVFPSLFEGSAKVILEAMASGLPVITTSQAADEKLVIDGWNGFRVEAGEPEMLASRMQKMAGDKERQKAMGRAALDAIKGHTWRAYGDRCAAICAELLRQQPESAGSSIA